MQRYKKIWTIPNFSTSFLYKYHNSLESFFKLDIFLKIFCNNLWTRILQQKIIFGNFAFVDFSLTFFKKVGQKFGN